MANDIVSFPTDAGQGGTWVAPDAVHETLPDGRVIQHAAKEGQTLSMKEAIRLGLVKPGPESPAPETKAPPEPPPPVVTLGPPPVNREGGAPAPFGAERMAASPPKGATATPKAPADSAPPTPAP